YFIQLAQQMEEKDTLCSMARRAGFGRGLMLWDNYLSAAGNLPAVSQMTTPGEFVTLSFGQGQLLASPLQLAGAINAIANDGVYIAPTAVKGVINQNTGEVVSPGPTLETLRIMKPETAKTLQKMLEAVITEGIAGTAAPEEGLAAGKTGTAQTGRMNVNEEELYDAWFAGFYPSESPRYTIVVFEDSTTRSGESLSPVFAELCNSLALFKDQKID
ncbi:MAG: penicillin-binding transpeptidase domain-containing protein, partial [Pygmaiobacter massiliensis]|nr:penicillin-binding transpeptidase domain-containing protein [Pygmaiobacter massiliensis]